MQEIYARESLEHLQKVQDFHDADAAGYRDRRYRTDTCEGIAYVTRKQIILGMATVTPGKVLDIGCGPGILTRDLLKRGHNVYSADLSTEMILTARNAVNGANAGFLVSDASHIPFLAGSMDMVLSIGLMCYIADHDIALSEIYRVLKPGSFAIIQINNIRWPFLYRTFTPVYHFLKTLISGKRYDSLNFKFNFSSSGKFLNKTKAAGFKIAERVYYDFRIPFIDILFPGFSVKMGKTMFRKRRNRLFRICAHGLLIKAEK